MMDEIKASERKIIRKKLPQEKKAVTAPAANLGVLNDIIGFRIRRIQNHLSRSFNELIAQHEVAPGTFSALALISANPGMSQAELSGLIGYDKASVVAIIDLLEDLGWAERRRTPLDRRRHSLFLLKPGQNALARLRKLAVQNEKLVHSHLSKSELEDLFRLLDKVYLACQKNAK